MTASMIWFIFCKELSDTLRDRRTLIFMFLIPALAVPALIFGLSRFSKRDCLRKLFDKFRSKFFLNTFCECYPGSNSVNSHIIRTPCDSQRLGHLIHASFEPPNDGFHRDCLCARKRTTIND